MSVLALGACKRQEPPKTSAQAESVPANSLSDARLHGLEEGDPAPAAPTDSTQDPTQPYTTKVGEASPSDPEASSSTASSSKRSAGSAGEAKGATGGKGSVSKTQCDQVMDRYLELEIAKNPQLKDVPPEVIEQAKQMARQQHGEAPCTATRAQYACAMAATSTAAWQRCMK